ncbi:U3 small nucleolar RNA-associated protein [Orbilia ellipsospora]|uniref:U3 small nucleolar RNA-associated protein n=1 Tax=Orbilia ellipsospora TaxID=2528407 RepID=A0AAV9X9C4_9PEZI
MDIHRCRFVDYIPSKIHALAFSHPSEYNPQSHQLPPSLRLAIGRSNGSIEIWNPTTWFHESTLHGGQHRSIEGLAWIRHSHYSVKHTELLRLFSIGNSTVVTEWDLVTGKPLAHFDCGKGVIWSIAAQPRKSWFNERTHSQVPKKSSETDDTEEEDSNDGMQLTVGCEDGSLVVLSVGDSPGSLSLSKIIPQSKPCRVLSLAYQSPTTIIAGTSDSKLRVFDTITGRPITTMSVGPKLNNKRQNAKKRDTYVWCVKYIPSHGGWIIAGDSLGEISLYDGKRYALRQKLKAHDADVLTLETNANGTQFFSSGVDKVTVKHELIGHGKRATWTQVVKKRFHKHDVRAMAGFEAGPFSVLVSGGVDMTPVVVPLRKFAQEYQYTLSALPQSQVVSTSSSVESRLLLAKFDREVKIWRVNTIDEVEAADDVELYGAVDEDQGRKLVGGIVVNTDENISSAAISPLGNLIAIATMATIKLFHLRPRKSTILLRISKLELPEKIASIGARKVLFSPDGNFLAFIAPNSEPYIFKITTDVDEDGKHTFEFGNLQHLDRKEREPAIANNKVQRKDGVIALGRGYERQINQVCFSPKGKYLFAADVGGWMEAWIVEDSRKGKWKLLKASLPRLPLSSVAVGFRPLLIDNTKRLEDSSEVFVMTADHTLHEFDVANGQVTAWSARNSDRLPKQFLKLKDRCFGISVVEEKGKGRRMWCWGHGWVFMFNVDRDLNVVKSKKEKDTEDQKGVKRKRGIVMVSGAGSEAINARSDMVKSSEVMLVGKAQHEGEDLEMEDVDSDEEFLVDKVRNDVRRKGGALELVQSESEDDSSSDEEEEDDSDNSSSDSSSNDDSDENEASDSELSTTEHPDPEDGGVKLDTEQMDIDTPASNAITTGATVAAKRGVGVPHWHTFQYRNVMAFLPIGDPKEDLEIVVVERPVADIKLPPAWVPKKDASRVQKFR